MTETGTLAKLLQSRRPVWRRAEGLLDCLSAVPFAPDDVRERFAQTLLDADVVAWEELVEWCEVWPSPPEAALDLEAWLQESEALGLAQEGLSALKVKGAVAASASIDAVMMSAKPKIMARVDKVLFAGAAAQREGKLGFPCAPWSWIAGGAMDAFLSSCPEASTQACELWVDGRLAHADASILAARLGDAQVLGAYRGVIAERTKEIWATRWNPLWSLDVARTESELESAHRLLELDLPHSREKLVVHQHAEGTFWPELGLVRYSDAEVVWGDATLGEMRTRVRANEPSADQDAWHALGCLRSIAGSANESAKRSVEVVAAVIESLHEGTMSEALAGAHVAFETGGDFGDDALRLLDRAFEIRILLNDVMNTLSGAGVDIRTLSKNLSAADDAHAEHDRATQLVDDELYTELTRDLSLDSLLDEGAWWGSRQQLDREVPKGVVEGALWELAEERRESRRESRGGSQGGSQGGSRAGSHAGSEGEQERGTVVSLSTARRQRSSAPGWKDTSPGYTAAVFDLFGRGAAHRTPAKLSQEVTQTLVLAASHESSEAGAGRVGRVPVLLLDEKNDKGIVAELRVWVDDHDSEAEFWGPTNGLQMMARDAVRDAFQAASAETPHKAAPYAFARHRVRLSVTDRELKGAQLEVDGRSLGLSAALAFASAWLGKPVSEDVMPMGTVTSWGEVGAIRGGRPKSAAARAVRTNARVLTATAGLGEVVKGHGVAVTLLSDALSAAGLNLTELKDMPQSARERERALGRLVEDIQDCAIGQHGEDRWSRLGDEVRRLADSLDRAPGKAKVLSHARCMAALAYSHAGRIDDARAVLRNMERPEAEGLEARALYNIVELGGHIDSLSLNEAAGQASLKRVHEDLDALREHSSHLSGQAAGTLGRAYTHLSAGDATLLDRALPWLELAVEEHKARAPHELPRSRIYLASALRMNGDLRDALEELVAGRRELKALTRPYSTEYEATCRLYLNYELARVLVALDRPEEALEEAAEALGECESRGWWPLLGVLRVVAWALRACDRTADADVVVARMREVSVSSDTAEYPKLVSALLEEAEGHWAPDGEIY